jgi:hypothetical protein
VRAGNRTKEVGPCLLGDTRQSRVLAAADKRVGIKGSTLEQDSQPDPGAPALESRLLRCSPSRSDERFALHGQQEQEF